MESRGKAHINVSKVCGELMGCLMSLKFSLVGKRTISPSGEALGKALLTSVPDRVAMTTQQQSVDVLPWGVGVSPRRNDEAQEDEGIHSHGRK